MGESWWADGLLKHGKEWETASVSVYPFQSVCSVPAVQAVLQKLVRNLFAEGNDLFREKDFKLSLVQYVEGLNVADYAASDEVTIPKELLCKLHVNRAACYFAMVSAFPRHPQESGRKAGLHWLPCSWKTCQEGIQPPALKEMVAHRELWYLFTIILCLAKPEEWCKAVQSCFCWSCFLFLKAIQVLVVEELMHSGNSVVKSQCLPVLTLNTALEVCLPPHVCATGRQWEGFGSWQSIQNAYGKRFWNNQALKSCALPFSSGM